MTRADQLYEHWFMVPGWSKAHLPWSVNTRQTTLCGRRVTRTPEQEVLVPHCVTCEEALEARRVYEARLDGGGIVR